MTENGGNAANAAGPGVPAAEALGSALTPKVARGYPPNLGRVPWDRLPTSPNPAKLEGRNYEKDTGMKLK